MKILFANTIDLDQDGLTLVNTRQTLKWEGLKNLPEMASLFAANGILSTWFVRCDDQIAAVHKDYCHLFKEYGRFFANVQQHGDEIGWHPHLYTRSDTGDFLPCYEDAECVEQLERTHHHLLDGLGSLRSSRIGEAYSSNQIMNTLSRLGIECDSTALPGVERNDNIRRINWPVTPNHPYYPSQDNYQIATTTGPKSSILEVPMTTAAIKAPYDIKPLRRYINLSYKKDIFRSAIESLRSEFEMSGDRLNFLVTIVHPDELLSTKTAHPLYSQSLECLKENLELLIKTFNTGNDALTPSTVSGLKNNFSEMTITPA